MVNTCSICGEVFDTLNFTPKAKTTQIMYDKNFCFTCAFWYEKILLHGDNVFVTSDWSRSAGSIIDKTSTKGFVGSAGRDFFVKFDNGRYEWYNNVWNQGIVPPHIRGKEGFEKLNPNATVITQEEYLVWLCSEINKFEHGKVLLCSKIDGHERVMMLNKLASHDNVFVFHPLKQTLNGVGYFDLTVHETNIIKVFDNQIQNVMDDYLVNNGIKQKEKDCLTVSQWRNK